MLAFVLLGAVASGLALLWALRRHAAATIKYTNAIIVGVPLLVALIALFSAPFPLGLMPAALPLAYAGVMYLIVRGYRAHFGLCARLFSTAATVLNDQPGLAWAAMGIKAALLAACATLTVACFAAALNGGFVLRYKEANVEANILVLANTPPGSAVRPAVPAPPETVPYCAFETDKWAKAYITFTSILLSWLACAAFQLRRWVGASVAAQWWATRAETSVALAGAHTAVSGSSTAPRATSVALRHGLGAGAGTIAFAGLVLFVMEQIKKAGTKKPSGRSKGGPNVAVMVLWCLFMLAKWIFAELMEYLTDKATMVAAISGAPLIASGRRAVSILKPHLGAALATWAIPGTVLGLMTLTLSMASSAMASVWAYGAAAATAKATGVQWPLTMVGAFSAAIAFFASLVLNLIVLSFFTDIILNLLDALFLLAASETSPENLLYSTGPDSPSWNGGASAGGPTGEKAVLLQAVAAMVPEETRKEREEKLAAQRAHLATAI